MIHNPTNVMTTMCKNCPFRVNNHELIAKITHRAISAPTDTAYTQAMSARTLSP